MWFLPSYGRPEAIYKMIVAGAELPDDLTIILTQDDPAIFRYEIPAGFSVQIAPAGSRLGDIFRWILDKWPDEPYYGMFGDDNYCLKPGSWKVLSEAAGRNFIGVSPGKKTAQGQVGISIMCLGGDLVRAMGTLAPAGLKHNFIDNFWQTIGEDFGRFVLCPDAVIEHRHPIHHEGAEMDDTYHRGSDDIGDDHQRFNAWINSNDRKEMSNRVALLLGVNAMALDMRTVNLSVCIPMHDGRMDVVFDQSLMASLGQCASYGMQWRKHVVTGGSNIGKCRETLMHQALATDCTHVMFVDDDMAWDNVRLIGHLIASGHDFVGVMGVKKSAELKFCGNFFPGVQQFHPVSQFLRVRDVGFGLVIIRRQVFEKLIQAFPELEYDAAEGAPPGYALFQEQIVVDEVSGKRLRLSEDLAFCRRWTRIGGEIYIDHQMALRHVGKTEYTGMVASILEVNDQAAAQQEAAE